MKPVLFCLFLIGLSLAGSVSASSDADEYDWYGSLIDANPYAGCPTCVFAYDDDGLTDPNPYAGCPVCVFAYDDDGLIDPNPYTGCPICSFYFYPPIESDPNSPDTCPTCGTTAIFTLPGSSSYQISYPGSQASPTYTFADGTPIPKDYLCPIHGIYCPDDPRPLEDRPGYAEAVAEPRPTLVIRSLPDTTAEFLRVFKSTGSSPISDRLDLVRYRMK